MPYIIDKQGAFRTPALDGRPLIGSSMRRLDLSYHIMAQKQLQTGRTVFIMLPHVT